MSGRLLSGIIISAVLCAHACSGGGGGGSTPTPTPSPTPTPTPTPVDAWTDVRSELEAFAFNDVSVIIGDGTTRYFSFERGNITETTPLPSASAAKMMAGLTFIRLIDQSVLELDTRAADVLTDYWATSPADERSDVTLAQLLSFTSGFNARPTTIGCWLQSGLELQTCAERIHDNGLDTSPGTAFAYGPEHLQVAAAMAEVATGESWNDIFRIQVGDPLNLSPLTVFSSPSYSNPRVSGGATVSADDFARMMAAVLAGGFVADDPAYTQDRTAGLDVAYSPIAGRGLDWHYGLGFWLECDAAPFEQSCVDDLTISSPGAFGFTPWIDFGDDYYGVIAVEESTGPDAQAAQDLAQSLQPLIETALQSERGG